jgi:hypothetical protein
MKRPIPPNTVIHNILTDFFILTLSNLADMVFPGIAIQALTPVIDSGKNIKKSAGWVKNLF